VSFLLRVESKRNENNGRELAIYDGDKEQMNRKNSLATASMVYYLPRFIMKCWLFMLMETVVVCV
jgi:hypothetical protein